MHVLAVVIIVGILTELAGARRSDGAFRASDYGPWAFRG